MADKVRHLVSRRLKDCWGWYWIPSASVAVMGLVSETLGRTVTDEATPAIKARANELNAQADEVRIGRKARPEQEAPGTVGFLVKEYRASKKWGRLRPRTQKDYRAWLDEFRDEFRELPLASMIGPVLEAWRDRVWEERGHYAAYHLIGTMRALWTWAEKAHHIPRGSSPARDVENPRPPKRRVMWALEQVCAFIDAAIAEGEFGFAAAMVLADCISQSPVDIWGLRASDYDGRSIIKDRRAKVAGEHPPMPLWEHVCDALDWHLSRRAHLVLLPDAPLFPPEGKNAFWVESTRHKVFQRIRARAGLPAHLQMQDMRRTGATEAGASGGSAIEIRDLLRHQTTSEASTYTLQTATSLRAVQAKRLTARARNEDES